jgi:excinuclease UvrABC helicase subunit UvrB
VLSNLNYYIEIIFLFFFYLQCEQGAAIDALYDLFYRKPQLLMIIGSACSGVTQVIAQLVSNWNILLVGTNKFFRCNSYYDYKFHYIPIKSRPELGAET